MNNMLHMIEPANPQKIGKKKNNQMKGNMMYSA